MDIMKFIENLMEQDLCECKAKENEPTKKTPLCVLEEIERESYICGDLLCIPKKKFYSLVKECNERV